MDKNWVDFRVVKAAVTMQMILDRYGIALKKRGQELRGKCPIHRGSDNKHLTVNVSKNVFKCFFESCGAHGNVLDFVAAMERCSVREAAIKLSEWFKVGEPGESVKGDKELGEELPIERGIYSDNNGGVYEVIAIATHAELSERLVVYRELFGGYKFWVIPSRGFQGLCTSSTQPYFKLVKKL